MKGLKYILMLNKMQHDELADRVGAAKYSVDRWVSVPNKLIPLEYNNAFIGLFNVPIIYLEQELTSKSLAYIIENLNDFGAITGLEYLLRMNDIQSQELSNKLGLNSANINNWIKSKQPIPTKYTIALTELFNVPKKYLQKTLTKEDIEFLFLNDNTNVDINKMREEPIVKVKKVNKKDVVINLLSEDVINKLKEVAQEADLRVEYQAAKIIMDYFRNRDEDKEEKIRTDKI